MNEENISNREKLLNLLEECVLDYKEVLEEMVRYFGEWEINKFCVEGFGGKISNLFEDEEDEE